MEPSEELKAYIEAEIIPRYGAFDAAHRTDHVRTVIAQSLVLAGHYEVDADMVYAIAAYHDTGLAYGRESHHIRSGEILLGDSFMRQRFTEEQMAVMRDAIEDHRASSDHAPRTIYGRIVAEADRCIDPETVIRRTIQYGTAHYPALSREGQFDRCVEHLQRKYAEGGYLRLWIPESDNARKLAELRELIRDTARLHETFGRIWGRFAGTDNRIGVNRTHPGTTPRPEVAGCKDRIPAEATRKSDTPQAVGLRGIAPIGAGAYSASCGKYFIYCTRW